MKKTIYNLELHESLQIDSGLLVQRVPSGWNYIYLHQVWDEDDDCYDDKILQIVFVPYDNAFQKTHK